MRKSMQNRIVGALGLGLALVLTGTPATADFKSDWKDLIAAAQKEGKVVLNAVPSSGMRQKLPAVFKKKFGVQLEFISTRTRQAAQRVIREASAGVLSTDLISGGQSTLARVLYPQGLLAPIKPLLIHPEINDKSVWLKGKPWFIDDKGLPFNWSSFRPVRAKPPNASFARPRPGSSARI